MKINENILMKHLTEATIAQVAANYQKNGYEISREAILDNIRADLVAKKNGEFIVFEFKSNKSWRKKRIEEIKQLRNYVIRNHGTGFKIVLVHLPDEAEIEVDDLDQILLNLVNGEPTLYDELATHIKIDDISDIELSKVTIHKDETELIGTAVVNLILQYGSDSDDGLRIDQSFLLDFHIVLGQDLEARVEKLELDTSDFYDPQEETQKQVASAS